MAGRCIEIVCTACGAESFVKTEPVYEGFRKTGERYSCAACGHEFPDEESVPYKEKRTPAVFGDGDKPAAPRVFSAGEGSRICRRCVHYVVNPFIQRCGLHHKEIEATATCGYFEQRKEEDVQENDCNLKWFPQTPLCRTAS